MCGAWGALGDLYNALCVWAFGNIGDGAATDTVNSLYWGGLFTHDVGGFGVDVCVCAVGSSGKESMSTTPTPSPFLRVCVCVHATVINHAAVYRTVFTHPVHLFALNGSLVTIVTIRSLMDRGEECISLLECNIHFFSRVL